MWLVTAPTGVLVYILLYVLYPGGQTEPMINAIFLDCDALMQIAVGSTNQTKVKAVERALDDVRFQGWELGSVIAGLEGGTAPEGEERPDSWVGWRLRIGNNRLRADNETLVIPVSASSGVAEQPFSDEETVLGAVNRARNALRLVKADIGIGLEGGVVETGHGLFFCAIGAR